MRKSLILIALMLLGVSSVSAAYAPINVQSARIDTSGDHNQLTIGFDWFRDHVGVGGVHSRTSTYNLPRIDWRHSLDTSIPTRVGLNLAMSAGATELEAGGTEFAESSAFGFSNLGLTLEAALIDEDDLAVTWYLNQQFPFIHNNLLVANTLRPVQGVNAYGFQTGAEYTITVSDDIAWHGDVGYRFDVPDAGATQHSLVYYNEAVWSGDEWGLSLGLLGNSVYTDDLGTDLRLVPGFITSVGDDSQLRIGVPIGLNPDSPDIGVQASIYRTF